MKYDVSLKKTFVSILDENGTIFKEGLVLSTGEARGAYLKETGLTFRKTGLESGQLSIPLCKNMRAQGFDVMCIDAKGRRTSLYEAAQVLLCRTKKPSKLKSWAMRLAKKKGNKKAIVALARKLSVIMHRMLVDKTEFCYE